MLTWTPDQWITAVGGCFGAYYAVRFCYEFIVALFGGPVAPTQKIELEITATVTSLDTD